jgi:hypothetical protein
MAELACVHDTIPVPRVPADIIAPPGSTGPRTRGPAAAGKWLTASVTDDIPAVIAAGSGEAARRDPGAARTWIALAGGNNQQITAIQAEAARRGVTVHIVIDFIHVLEYLWGAAWSLFETGDPDAEKWVAAQATKILHGKSAQVAAGIRRRATTFGYSPAERTGASGWPIATGVIEGARRWLVKDRMDITGARWGLDSAEAILKLRALTANSDFDDYWTYHLQREHQRIHQSRYRDHLVA